MSVAAGVGRTLLSILRSTVHAVARIAKRAAAEAMDVVDGLLEFAMPGMQELSGRRDAEEPVEGPVETLYKSHRSEEALSHTASDGTWENDAPDSPFAVYRRLEPDEPDEPDERS